MAKTIKAGLRPEIDVSSASVLMQVKEGDKVLDSTRFHWNELPMDIRQRIKLHGLSTLLQQRTSDIKERPLDKLEAMQEVYDRWMSGEWAKEREGGLRQVPAIFEVLAKLKGVEVGAIQAAWKKLSDEQRDEIKAKYAEEIEEVEKARSESNVDLTDML